LQSRTTVLTACVVLLACGQTWAGPWRADEGNTRGWVLMSPRERLEHQEKIRSFTNYDDCHAYQIARHRLMQERAARLGLALPAHGRDVCAHLRPTPHE
jgi:hypothetical protein